MDIGYSAGSYDHGKMRWALVLASASIGPRKRKSALWLHVRDYEYATDSRATVSGFSDPRFGFMSDDSRATVSGF